MAEKEIIEPLTKLGLTMYEARIFTALTTMKNATVREIYHKAKVPRSAVYGVLEKLQEKDMVEVAKSKPTIFRALPPAQAMKKLELVFYTAKKQATKMLEQIYGSVSSTAIEEAVWILKGKKNIDDKINALIASAKKEVIISGSSKDVLKQLNILKPNKRKKIKIQIITMEEDSNDAEILEKWGEVIFLPEMKEFSGEEYKKWKMTMLLIDRKVAFYGVSYPVSRDVFEETAFWSDGHAYVSYVDISFRQMIKFGKKYVTKKKREGACLI